MEDGTPYVITKYIDYIKKIYEPLKYTNKVYHLVL